MPLEFLPNQPIIFEKPIGDYPCLNNDQRTYGQLMQDGDELCMQWKLQACNEPLCEPDMVMDPVGSDELGAWTVGGGWSSASSTDIAFDGTGNPGGLCDQTLAGLTTGAAYILELNVTTYTGLVTYEVIIDLQTVYTIDAPGTYKIGFTAPSASFGIAFNPLGTSTAGDQFVAESISLKQYTSCWIDNLNSGLPSWSYSFDGANGKFCSLDETGGDLINTNAISAPGTYHAVELTVSDCTQGGVIITLGGLTMTGQTSGNGVFRFYGVPTFGVDLVISKTNSFDGCISQVSVYDYGDIDSYKVHFETDDAQTFSADYSVDAFEDRIVWCKKLSDLTWTVDGLPDGALTCQLLKTFIYDPCDATEYESVNYINYLNTGWECTKVVEAWSDGYAFGFYFGDIAAPDFVLRQRLRFLAFNPVYKNQGEEYLYSSGNTGRSFAQSQKARTAWFDYMDEYAHDCTRVQLLSQKLLIENYAFYYPTEDYEPEWNERGAYNLAQSRVTLFHEEAIFGSTCGTMANAVCPPQVVPTPVPCESTTLGFKSVVQSASIDWSDIYTITIFYFTNGTSLGVGTGTYDLTTIGGRNSLLSGLISTLSNEFGITATGIVDLTGTTLTIDISGPFVSSFPTNYAAVSFRDGAGVHFAISTIAS